MAKNDFDVEFDFEKEYGFDPNAILGSDYSEEDLDLSQFEDDFQDVQPEKDPGEEYDAFDLSDIDLDGIGLDEDEELYAPDVQEAYSPKTVFFAEEKDEESDFEPEPADMDFQEETDALDFEDEDDFDDNEDLTAGIDFSRRTSFFGEPEAPEAPVYEPEYAPEEELPAEETVEDIGETEEVMEEEVPEDTAGQPSRRRGRTKGAMPPVSPTPQKPPREPIKLTVPPFLMNLVRLYFPTRQEIQERMEGGEARDGRRRRKPTKQQIFKEFYLPGVILGVTAVLMLSFVIGAVSNAIDRALVEQKEKEQLAQQESIAAEQMAFEAKALLDEAEILAQSYDYQKAVDLLDTYTGEPTQEMTIKRAEYVNAKSMLVEHQDPTLIPNLSFHVLIYDMARAMADDDNLAGQYNRNFVSTDEFSKILNQLYLNNFVLVDFDSFVTSNSVDGTSSSLFADSIWLPEGKKPVMITETMVNYFNYMVDGNDDGKPDSGGDGFASRLVVDANGDIKAEYVDENNVTHVGNYDLVPILEDFIAQHPDFCYRGARATLAVSGSEGIFGYRIQSETIAKKGQDYYNEQVVGATKVVAALKAKGYRLACYSFDNKDYKGISAAMVQEDLQKWRSQISPVIGELDTIVFARGGDIGDYTGGKFDVLTAAGFRFMLKSSETPYTEVNNAFVRQSRLMVTGENMVAKASMFTDNGLFDPNTVLDLATRGNVPTG